MGDKYSVLARDYKDKTWYELYNENAELRKKLKKARKEKKRWKRKYFELEESFTVIYYIDKDGYISDKRTDRYCIPIKRMKV